MRSVFLSYHHADHDEVAQFIQLVEGQFADVRAVGVSDGDDFINSRDDDFVIARVREKYVAGTAATIVLLGASTWSRRYVDWEIAATMHDDTSDSSGGLLGVRLPSTDRLHHVRLPSRLEANVCRPGGGPTYAECHDWPATGNDVAFWVEQALFRRDRSDPACDGRSGLQPIDIRATPG